LIEPSKTQARCLASLAKEIRGVEKDLVISLAERLVNDEHVGLRCPPSGLTLERILLIG
jgi:hypothetical protein